MDWLSDNAEAVGIEAVGPMLRFCLRPLERYAHAIIDNPENCYGLSVVMTVNTKRLYDVLRERNFAVGPNKASRVVRERDSEQTQAV